MDIAIFEAIVSGSVFAVVAVNFVTGAYRQLRGEE
jgi:hypothetical protein